MVSAATRLFLTRGYAATTMRSIATEAGVSIGTVEAHFQTKARALKAAIDAAIAGDDVRTPMLEREWADRARVARTPEDLLAVAAAVITASQHRSAGLVLAVFEAAGSDADLMALSTEMVTQRHGTASWIVEALARIAPLHPDLTTTAAVETLWLMMDPAVFVRLTRDRGWAEDRYRSWLARSVRRLLVADHPGPT